MLSFFPGASKVYRRCVPLLCLGLVGLLQILPVTASAEEVVLEEEKPSPPSVIVTAEKPGPGARVAILPFENMSGRFFDIDHMMKPFYENLDKIFRLSSMDEVDEAILQLRLRHTGFLSTQETMEIRQRLGVKAIILGMICLYQETPEPSIGLIMKMIGTGEGAPILWSKSANKSGNLTESWFGRNRISKVDSLIDRVAKDLIRDMPIHLVQKGDDFEL